MITNSLINGLRFLPFNSGYNSNMVYLGRFSINKVESRHKDAGITSSNCAIISLVYLWPQIHGSNTNDANVLALTL